MKYDIDFTDPKVAAALVEKLISNTPVAYIVLDRDMKVHFINDYFMKLRNLTRNDVLGKHCYDLSNNGVPCAVCAVQSSISTGKNHSVLRKDVLPNGVIRYIDDHSIPLYREDGTFDYILEVMIDRSREMLLREQANEIFYSIVKTLVTVLNKKDVYTSNHSNDVSAISTKLATYIGLSDDEIYSIGLAGLLHDIGKVYIPDQIINKPSKLTDDEYQQIKKHPSHTFRFLSDLESFDSIREMSLFHHERWDGRGYPNGIAGENIPLGGRIIAIADTYDAMTSDRPYRKGLPHETAVAEIRKNAGTQFDPELALQFCEMAETLWKSRVEIIMNSEEAITKLLKKRTRAQVTRKIVASQDEEEHKSTSFDISKLASDEYFTSQIFKYTPAYYIVVTESFDPIYLSSSITEALKIPAEEIMKHKCFEINNKNMDCFRMTDGAINCPIVRAIHSGQYNKGKVTEYAGTKEMHMEIHAVPIDLEDRSRNTLKCAIEILFDRTDDINIQKLLEHDTRRLIILLEDLLSDMDKNVAENSDEIIKEYSSFSEYLEQLDRQLKSNYAQLLNQ